MGISSHVLDLRMMSRSSVVYSSGSLDAQEMSTSGRLSNSEIMRIVDAIRDDFGSNLGVEDFEEAFLAYLEDIPGLELVDGTKYINRALTFYQEWR